MKRSKVKIDSGVTFICVVHTHTHVMNVDIHIDIHTVPSVCMYENLWSRMYIQKTEQVGLATQNAIKICEEEEYTICKI